MPVNGNLIIIAMRQQLTLGQPEILQLTDGQLRRLVRELKTPQKRRNAGFPPFASLAGYSRAIISVCIESSIQ